MSPGFNSSNLDAVNKQYEAFNSVNEQVESVVEEEVPAEETESVEDEVPAEGTESVEDEVSTE